MSGRWDDLVLKDIAWFSDETWSYEIEPNDRLIEMTDWIRKGKGFNDFPGDSNNNVWYSFNLVIHFDTRVTDIYATVNSSEKDDFEEYLLLMTSEESRILLFKAFRQYIKEVEGE